MDERRQAQDQVAARQAAFEEALENSPVLTRETLVALAREAGTVQGQAEARTQVLRALNRWADAVKERRPTKIYQRFQNRVARDAVAIVGKIAGTWPGRIGLGALGGWLATHGVPEAGLMLAGAAVGGPMVARPLAAHYASAAELSNRTARERRALARALDKDIGLAENRELDVEWDMRGGEEDAYETLKKCSYARFSARFLAFEAEMDALRPEFEELLALGVPERQGSRVRESELVDRIQRAASSLGLRDGFQHDSNGEVSPVGEAVDQYVSALTSTMAQNRLKRGTNWEIALGVTEQARREAVRALASSATYAQDLTAFVDHFAQEAGVDRDVLTERALAYAMDGAGTRPERYAFDDKSFAEVMVGNRDAAILRSVATSPLALEYSLGG